MGRTLESRRSFRAIRCSSGTPITEEPELTEARVLMAPAKRMDENER
jgi:hypothetical protein